MDFVDTYMLYKSKYIIIFANLQYSSQTELYESVFIIQSQPSMNDTSDGVNT